MSITRFSFTVLFFGFSLTAFANVSSEQCEQYRQFGRALGLAGEFASIRTFGIRDVISRARSVENTNELIRMYRPLGYSPSNIQIWAALQRDFLEKIDLVEKRVPAPAPPPRGRRRAVPPPPPAPRIPLHETILHQLCHGSPGDRLTLARCFTNTRADISGTVSFLNHEQTFRLANASPEALQWNSRLENLRQALMNGLNAEGNPEGCQEPPGGGPGNAAQAVFVTAPVAAAPTPRPRGARRVIYDPGTTSGNEVTPFAEASRALSTAPAIVPMAPTAIPSPASQFSMPALPAQ